MQTKVGNLESGVQLSRLEAETTEDKSTVMKEANGINNAFEPDNNLSINEIATMEEKRIGNCNEAFEPDAKEQFRENMRVCHERLKPAKTVLPESRPVSHVTDSSTDVKVRSLTFLQGKALVLAK